MPPRASAREVQFQPYNASHPALLEEIEVMLSGGLARITKENKQNVPPPNLFGSMATDHQEEAFQSDKLAVYRQAFAHYIHASSLHRPFLKSVQQEYDNGIDKLQGELRKFSTMRIEISIMEERQSEETKSLENKHNDKIAQYVSIINKLEKRCTDYEDRIIDTEAEAVKLREATTKAKAEWEEMSISCGTLTSSLQRYEQANKQLKITESAHNSEHIKLVISEQKANDEAEKLRLLNNELESETALMVS